MRYFIAANWKLNKTIGETKEFLSALIPAVNNVTDVDIVIAPPFTALSAAGDMIKGTNLQLVQARLVPACLSMRAAGM
jgi:triosephosphate isomerase